MARLSSSARSMTSWGERHTRRVKYAYTDPSGAAACAEGAGRSRALTEGKSSWIPGCSSSCDSIMKGPDAASRDSSYSCRRGLPRVSPGQGTCANCITRCRVRLSLYGRAARLGALAQRQDLSEVCDRLLPQDLGVADVAPHELLEGVTPCPLLEVCRDALGQLHNLSTHGCGRGRTAATAWQGEPGEGAGSSRADPWDTWKTPNHAWRTQEGLLRGSRGLMRVHGLVHE
jgi:hypothetical protein